MNRADFQRLSEIRINEARALLETGQYPGAFYLAGYAVECALKACIAKKIKQYDFPDKELVNKSYTHNLMNLVGVAGLTGELAIAEKANPKLGTNWLYVADWDEESRYNGSIGEKEAKDLIDAITDGSNGVLEWLKKRW